MFILACLGVLGCEGLYGRDLVWTFLPSLCFFLNLFYFFDLFHNCFPGVSQTEQASKQQEASGTQALVRQARNRPESALKAVKSCPKHPCAKHPETSGTQALVRQARK